MGVYVRRMKMPNACYECEFYNGVCPFDGVGVFYDPLRERADECPLLEVPDHGDLIDRDAFVAEKKELLCADCRKRKSLETGRFVYEIGDCVCRACDTHYMLNYIEEAPMVIPAERSEASLCDNCDWKNEKGCSWCKRMERSEDGET